MAELDDVFDWINVFHADELLVETAVEVRKLALPDLAYLLGVSKKRDMRFSKRGYHTFFWSTDMSQQALYQILGLHGYQITNVERDEKQLLVHARPQPHRVCCSACDSRDVIRRGESTRMIRNLPC